MIAGTLCYTPIKPEKEWFLTKEAAEYLCLSENALRKHVLKGNLVPDSYGGRGRCRAHRFRKETLDKFLAGK